VKIGDFVVEKSGGGYTVNPHYGLVTGRSYGDRVVVLWTNGTEEDMDPYYLVLVSNATNNNNPV
jgi:hypothetical protein